MQFDDHLPIYRLTWWISVSSLKVTFIFSLSFVFTSTQFVFFTFPRQSSILLLFVWVLIFAVRWFSTLQASKFSVLTGFSNLFQFEFSFVQFQGSFFIFQFKAKFLHFIFQPSIRQWLFSFNFFVKLSF